MSKQLDFIQRIAPHAMKAMRESGVLASLTMAQAILESGWGKQAIENNIFGIKAGSSWKGKTKEVETTEYDSNKKPYRVKAMFRAYDSIEESIKDHNHLFMTLERYSNLRGETDYRRACYLVYKDGYATDPNYPSLLISIIEQWKLDQYDTLAVKESVSESTVAPHFKGDREFVMEKGISNGADPKEPVTREQMWAMVHRLYDVLKKEQKA